MLKENKSALKYIAREFNLSSRQVEQFEFYVELLEAWSLRTNLISKNDRHRIVSRHIVESLEVTRYRFVQDSCSVLDLGSGSGLPGIPLAIFYPRAQFILLDSKRMKILFLQDVVERLSLNNVQVVCARAEDFSLDLPCDVLTARAVARLAELWRLGCSFLKSNGLLVAFKGGELNDEVDEVENAFDVHTQIYPFQEAIDQECRDKKIVTVSSRK